MLLRNQKALFIHIPKTGGTSIESIFDPRANEKDVDYKHFTLDKMLNRFPECQEYFKFTFVRNPWDLTASMFKFAKRKPDFKVRYPHLIDMNFTDWVKSDFFKTPTLRYINMGTRDGKDASYFDFIHSRKSGIDFIGKFEHLQDDFNEICRLIGIKEKILPHHKKGGATDYRDLYDKESIEIVRRKYSREIKLFGYDFD